MIRVSSEVGRLRRVVVQPPGAAHERMMPAHIEPQSPDYVLFDDLVHVANAQREHADLCAVLGTVAQVDRFEDLVTTVLEDKKTRDQVISRIAQTHNLPDGAVQTLENMEAAALTQTLLAGTMGGEIDGLDLFPPVPNLIFTRDLAATVGELVIVANASKKARQRESVLTWAVVDHHPLFAQARISATSRVSRGRAPLTIEGGDVLVISDTLVCIGASERTTWSAIVRLSTEIFHAGFTRVLVVEMPKQRSSMHLDTVFTLTSTNTCTVYKPLLEKGNAEEAEILRLRSQGQGGSAQTVVEAVPGDLLDALSAEGHPLQPVYCGGNHPIHRRREQWTDGANYVALAPGIVVGYARNEHTAQAMAESGFRVVDTHGFLRDLQNEFQDDPEKLLSSGQRYAIHVVGSELSRGRGGPRCLTLPLERD